jgi:hypothetical protein
MEDCRSAVSKEGWEMKRQLVLGLMLTASLFNSGCFFLNRYDSDPNRRMQQLLNESENLRQMNEERIRFWMNGQPSQLSYERLSGSIGPG